MTVIHITLGEELPTIAQNKLRANLHMAQWKASWRRAIAEKDSDAMDRLDKQYEMVGMP